MNTEAEANEKRAELKKLMSDYSVNSKVVAQILGIAHQTVRNWRSPAAKTIPASKTLRLLKFELEARKSKQEKTPADANS